MVRLDLRKEKPAHKENSAEATAVLYFYVGFEFEFDKVNEKKKKNNNKSHLKFVDDAIGSDSFR